MTDARKRRGRRTEQIIAAWYRSFGWGDAEAIASALPGRDIKGMPWLAPEVKARKGLDLMAWIKQAEKNAGNDLPYLIIRMNGQGEESIKDFIVALRHEEFVLLLIKAGYLHDSKNCVPCKLTAAGQEAGNADGPS